MRASIAGIALMGALLATPAHAAYEIDIQEDGADVVVTGSGSFDLTGLTVAATGGVANALIQPNTAFFLSPGFYRSYRGISGPGNFGTGGQTPGGNASAYPIGIFGQAGLLLVPQGYVSGTILGHTTTIFGSQSFASLGLTPGNYMWTWGSGANADSLRIQIGAATAAVPEPAVWAMMILGFGFIGGAMRRRAAKPSYA